MGVAQAIAVRALYWWTVGLKTPANSKFSLIEGRRVTTLEGLPNADLHPVQQAFIEEQAAQCGYCTTGLIMRLVSLLETTPRPAVSEVRSALDRHLCRCGSHSRVLKVIDRLFSEEFGGTTTSS